MDFRTFCFNLGVKLGHLVNIWTFFCVFEKKEEIQAWTKYPSHDPNYIMYSYITQPGLWARVRPSEPGSALCSAQQSPSNQQAAKPHLAMDCFSSQEAEGNYITDLQHPQINQVLQLQHQIQGTVRLSDTFQNCVQTLQALTGDRPAKYYKYYICQNDIFEARLD